MDSAMPFTPQENGQGKIKFIELFAGIGGFRLGIEQASSQFECVYANEWDKYAGIIYNKRFGSVTNDKIGSTRTFTDLDTRDIRTVTTEEIPDHDLLVGGFPCQAFSIAGKRGGFNDTRGTLFFEIARIFKDKHTKYFILENVKGLLSHNNGDTFKTIISTLTELGYDLQWQVLNSKNFGVPQNRERVFIVGHLRGEPRPEVFPISTSSGQIDELQGLQVGAITARRGTAKSDGDYVVESIRQTQEMKQIVGGSQGYRVYDPQGISSTLAGEAGGVGAKTGLYAIPMRWVRTEKGKEYRREAQKQGKDLTPFNNGYRELVESKEKVSGCITNALQKDALLKQETRIRRLTPLECERLQGFPDGWTEGISDTQRYKCLGNAVTTNVVYEVAKRLASSLKPNAD